MSTGLCECGCGQRTNVIQHTCVKRGLVKGAYYRFVAGHNTSGRKWLDETRAKMASRMRQSPTSETRAKIAATLRGRPLSQAHIDKLRAASTGRTHDQVVRGRISAALKGKPKSAAHRAALSAVNMGKPLSAAARAAMKATWHAKSYEQRLAASAPGRAAAHPGKHRGAHNPKWWAALSEVDRQRIIAARASKLRDQWANLSPEERALRKNRLREIGMAGALASRRVKPTSIEKAVATLLDALGVAYQSEQRLGRYIVDFLIPDRMLIVECDGSYWHGKPNVQQRDAIRDEWLTRQGYQVVRLRESDIRSGGATAQLKAAVA